MTAVSRASEELAQLGRAIARVRRNQGLTQEGLAELSGLHRTYVGSVERGRRNPTYLSLLAVARGLKVDLSELIGLVER